MGNHKVILLPTYKTHLTFVHGVSGFKIPKGTNPDHFQGSYAGRCMYRFEQAEPLCNRLVIHVKDPARGGVIVHELYHAVSFIFNAIGATADFENDEPCAYLIQYLYEEIMGWLNKR